MGLGNVPAKPRPGTPLWADKGCTYLGDLCGRDDRREDSAEPFKKRKPASQFQGKGWVNGYAENQRVPQY